MAQSVCLIAPGPGKRVVGGRSALQNTVEISGSWSWRGDALWSYSSDVLWISGKPDRWQRPRETVRQDAGLREDTSLNYSHHTRPSSVDEAWLLCPGAFDIERPLFPPDHSDILESHRPQPVKLRCNEMYFRSLFFF